MDHYKESGKVDPDYESYNSALELNEEEDKKEALIKIKKIIEEEYSKEILLRQEQVEQIELQICKVRKLLHLLRYALIMSYYKKKELEYSGTEEEPSTSDTFTPPDKQNRIHPAVKKLLGKNVNNLDYLNFKDKRKSNTRSGQNSVKNTDSVNSPETKKIKLDLDAEPLEQTTNDDRMQETSFEYIRNRKKTKYRIVVGNISKWMPLSEEDILTHKWMVYVRGPKDKPDVSHFIEKVVFYLHPSYKPHDVVEVSEYPFHLSRRGWGEFPVRVQIFFKVTLNKPIDVIHNIKLDKTYTGRQTLGNETVLDVFLYDDNVAISGQKQESENHSFIEVEDIKIEDVDIEAMASTSIEHDYCSGQIKQEVEEERNEEYNDNFDHCYCLPSSQENQPKVKKEKIEQDENNSLIYGLDKSYMDIEETNMQTNKTNNFHQLVQLNRRDIKFNNTKIIVFGKKIDGCILTNFSKILQSPKISKDLLQLTNKCEQNNFKIALSKNKFKNMGEILPYLFKRLPLYTDMANNVNYKRMYPFTASTLKEFVSWNVGKRRSAEWSRARTIRNIVRSEQITGAEDWSTKTILMYGRSHDYTPFISYGLFQRDSEEKNLLLSCYTKSSSFIRRNSLKNPTGDDVEITVNVDSDIEMTSPKKINAPAIDISDPNFRLEYSFVRQTALDCGIILKPEEIEEGVKVNGAEMMILTAMKCFAENLIRRAKNHRVCTKFFSPSTSAINREDVEIAINERPEMLALRQFRNERRNVEYFS